MANSLADLLAMDAIASRHGCALKPKLRQAIEADLRFPGHVSTTQSDQPIDQNNLPENVHSLISRVAKQGKKCA
ncbi:hypothetical protein ABLN87_14065 [Ruegeria sp. SCPT10]|uniref:hypothetical protein n=1 Tax=Ruegeria sp. SCP10 TaxID=3141377 RepID=UPI003336C259